MGLKGVMTHRLGPTVLGSVSLFILDQLANEPQGSACLTTPHPGAEVIGVHC